MSDVQTPVWRKLAALLLVGGLAGLSPVSAPAGDCRAVVRPLLLQQSRGAALIDEAREVCEVEAALGDPDAEYQLALFSLGLVEWAPSVAIPKILSAAEKGVPEAQYWLAWQYEEGPLIANDVERARHWYQRAADAEHRLALHRLADAHDKGQLGLRQDRGRAALYRARAERCANQAG